MNWLRSLFVRLGYLFHKENLDRELQQELANHVQLQISDNLRSGMTPEEARSNALLKLGGVEQTKESVRDHSGIPLLDTLLRDLCFGLRMLRKSPGSTVISVLTLSLGIGACGVIFSVFYGVLVRPLAYPSADRVVRVYMHFHPQNMDLGTMSDADFQDLVAQNRSFETSGIFYEGATFELVRKSEPELVP